MLLLSASDMSQGFKKATSILIGLGCLYPLAWLTMFLLAPSIGRHAAHNHIITELFTYVGVISLASGFILLIANLFFNLLTDKDET